MSKEVDQGLPPGKHIFGLVKVGEKGQIVIPKDARDVFGISAGDSLLVLGDEQQGIALVKSDQMKAFARMILGMDGEQKHANK